MTPFILIAVLAATPDGPLATADQVAPLAPADVTPHWYVGVGPRPYRDAIERECRSRRCRLRSIPPPHCAPCGLERTRELMMSSRLSSRLPVARHPKYTVNVGWFLAFAPVR